eukprot:7013611-Pyramimonas_sp.AAC.1
MANGELETSAGQAKGHGSWMCRNDDERKGGRRKTTFRGTPANRQSQCTKNCARPSSSASC